MEESSIMTTFVIILCTLNAKTNGQFTCDPVTDCSNSNAGDLVPDPCNCERYYLCLDTGLPSTIPLSCDDGYYFDHNLSTCDLEEVPGSCDNICNPRCNTLCPPDETTIIDVANENDCSTYYSCLPPGPVLVECPGTAPYFNGTVCTSEASQCCNFCTPYCDKANTQIQDPCDCAAYYICLNTGQPSSTSRFVCDNGTYYDERTGDCVDGVCISQCTAEKCGSSGSIC